MKRIAVFASGRGTNLQAIIDNVKRKRLKVKIALVVSDNPDAFAIKRAKREDIPTFVLRHKGFATREAYDRQIIKQLEKFKVDLVVLAGFMRLLSPYFTRKYKNRILNLHPALLPSFKGTEGIKDALDYGVKITGPTVHFVDEKFDHGPIVLQKAVNIREDDTEQTLAFRIHSAEHKIYPEAIKLFCEGRLKITGRTVKILHHKEK